MYVTDRVILIGAATLVLGAMGFMLALHGGKKLRRFRLITDTPTTPIARLSGLSGGLVEARGRVVATEDTLESPMTGQQCVYYRFRVQEKQTKHRRGKARTKMVTIVDDVRAVGCEIQDATGRAVVTLLAAELHLKADAKARSGFLNAAPEALQRTLAERYDKQTQGLLFNKTMTYEETVLCPGDDLYVLGAVARDAGGMPTFRATSTEDVPFLISDRPEAELASTLRTSAYGYFAGTALCAALLITVIAVVIADVARG